MGGGEGREGEQEWLKLSASLSHIWYSLTEGQVQLICRGLGET